MKKVNSDFYPAPLKRASTSTEADGRKHHRFEHLTAGFLTKDDFVKLYDHCGDMLHAQNPYRGRNTIHTRLSAQEWFARIENLVKVHQTRLVTSSCFIVLVPDKDGKVHLAHGLSKK